MKASPTSPRLFQNDWLDFFSRSPWWTVPIFWIPTSCYLFSYGWQRYPHISALTFFITSCAGFVAWTLTEYWLHRAVFHWAPTTGWGVRFHYLTHGIHHELPNDPYRLVLPLGFSILISLPFALFFYSLLGEQLFFPFFGGYLIGYTIYDVMHYALHHTKSNLHFFKTLKKHHMRHHFNRQYSNKKYGVSSTLWDHVFRTY